MSFLRIAKRLLTPQRSAGDQVDELLGDRHEEWDDATQKHLEFIQAVIARLAQNGSLAKGWAVTIAGVFFAFAVQAEKPILAIASIATTLVFWGLDAYFLYGERQFRQLYERVRIRDARIATFYMNATERPEGVRLRHRLAEWVAMLFRFPILITYGGLSIAAALMAALIYFGGVPPSGIDARPTPSPSPSVLAGPDPSATATTPTSVSSETPRDLPGTSP